ncbi:MAG TPA: hypothetical protein VFM16_03480 [Holophagaceae bacterium]|nr:hypothetical protein [Holophagaceae bacterium]
MRLRGLLLPALILALAAPARAQVFAGAFNAKRDPWEIKLKAGQAAEVRQEIEAFLAGPGATASPSDYGDQHALVGALGLDARAAVALGDWEGAVASLKRASAAADQNFSTTEVAFAKLRAEHADRLQAWKGELSEAQGRLDQLNASPGLTEEQMKLKAQLETFVAEHKASIQHSEDALKAMDGALATLRQEKEDYAKSASDWQGFLDREKTDIEAAGGVKAYVAQKAAQVKADDTKPREERLAYARRLLKLDAGSPEALRLESALAGRPVAAAPAKKAVPRRKQR